MSSLLSLANTFVRRVFPLEPFTVTEVRIEDYVHHDILDREDSLIYHQYTSEQSQVNYEIVLYKENQTRNHAFRYLLYLVCIKFCFIYHFFHSIYRSSNSEESHIYFLRLRDKLPVFSQNFPNLVTVSHLNDLCQYINNNPSQNLAHVCAYFGHADYFRHLQCSPSSDVVCIINAQDEHGKTPLQISIEKERLSVVQNILQLSPILDLVDDEENNILHKAAHTNRNIIEAICSSVISRSNQMLPNINSNSQQRDPVSIFQLLNTRNQNNFTPLYLACLNDKPDCVKELLKNGADVNGASICDNNHPKKDEFFDLSDNKLISKLNDKDMKNGGTPLHWCKSAEVVEMLADTNCNMNARNFYGDTALHIMITRTNLSCVITLLSHGADVNAVGANGNTPLHLAIKVNIILWQTNPSFLVIYLSKTKVKYYLLIQ